jgi:hypothetical protein
MSKARATQGHPQSVKTGKPKVTKSQAGTATAATSHEALVAIGLMLAFVFVMVMVAGVGPKAGRTAVLVMVVLLAGQAIGHVNPFVTWVSDHPLVPGTPTFTVSGESSS